MLCLRRWIRDERDLYVSGSANNCIAIETTQPASAAHRIVQLANTIDFNLIVGMKELIIVEMGELESMFRC